MARALGLALLWALCMLLSPSASAATQEQAAASCNTYYWQLPAGSSWHCDIVAAATPYYQLVWTDPRTNPPTQHPADSDKRFFWTMPTAAQCAAKPSYTASFGSNVSVCNGGCVYAPSSTGGETWTVRGIDGGVRKGGAGVYKPTGATCGAAPPPDATPHRLCGGGSCYDSTTGQFCALNGSGQQVCVPKPAPGAPGGCASSGGTTLCAGNPPPLPPNPPISDPPSQIAGNDHFTNQTGSGPINNTTINNYNDSGSAPSSGAGAADNKPPAPSSSSPAPAKDNTSASGGDDCNSPPICEGSAATCMVAKQTWLLRCPPGGQGAGADDGDTSVPGLDGVGESPGAGFMRSETLLDKLDSGGLVGGGTMCPRFPAIRVEMFGIDYDSDPPGWCDLLTAAGKVIMLLAAFISLRVLSEK